MAKLSDKKTELSDIQEYLKSESDLAFELQVLKLLKNEGFKCAHGGAYDDPITKKTREFDIRAEISNDGLKFKWAVECKNLRSNFPLLVSCVPRSTEEAFHQLCFGCLGQYENPDLEKYLGKKISVSTFHFQESQLYKTGDPVGKSCAQIGRTIDKQIYSSDNEIYDKWSQALSSSYDLLTEICQEIEKSNFIGFCFFLPVLVVPDEKLWVVHYSEDGQMLSDPKMVDRCQYFVGKSFYAKWSWTGHSYTFSHLEIMTFKGLKSFIEELKNKNDLVEAICPFFKKKKENN